MADQSNLARAKGFQEQAKVRETPTPTVRNHFIDIFLLISPVVSGLLKGQHNMYYLYYRLIPLELSSALNS